MTTSASTEWDPAAAAAEIEVLQESLADMQLALEDAGWRRAGDGDGDELTRDGHRRACSLARAMATGNPLIKRGLNVRIAYIWGQGVTVSARATGASDDDAASGGQDVNAVVQAFLDDDANVASFSGSQAREELERALGTDGNVFLALFTRPLTGRVVVRSIPFAEIDEVITNPDDRDEPWFYRRRWTEDVVEGAVGADGQRTTRTRSQERTAYHPALGFRPRMRPRTIDGHEVLWDAPIDHTSVNRLDGWKFGVGDAFAALAWARAYKTFLEDWATLVKALSRYAYKATAKGGSRAQQLRAGLARTAVDPATGQPAVGGTAVVGGDVTLEAVPKTGATIDSDSGRPLASMVAAALDVPVTMLLGDPGQTGARAVAETLDKPTQLTMLLRRALWAATHRRVLGYVIDQAVKAPQGDLQGTVRLVDGREVVTLADDTDRTIDVDWPDLEDIDVPALVKAIVEADGTGKVPPLVVARLLLLALGVEDVDEHLEDLTDDDGNFVDPAASAGQAAVDAFRRGEDPASAVA